MIDPLVQKKGVSFLLIPVHLGLVIYTLFLFPLFMRRMDSSGWLLYSLSLIGCIGILAFLFIKSKPLFVASVFFFLITVLSPVIVLQRRLLGFSFPGVDFILPFIGYFILLGIFPKFRNHISWLSLGRGTKLVWILGAVTVVLSAAALLAWRLWTNWDIGNITGMIPSWPLPFLLLGGLGFAVSNAFAEEAVFRGMIRDGILSYAPIPAELLVTAGLFAASHLNGFPRGVWGVGMAAVWGLALGIIRNRSKGLFFPWIAHVAADLVIFTLLIVFR